jgi:UDP-N-acetylmuramoylalanine--D-glutamate ligase
MRVPWSDHEWRRVLVYGMGKSGVAATRLLRSRGVAVLGVDGRREVALGDLEGDPMIELRLGDESSPLPPGVDGLVLSPGVPASSPLVREAEQRGVPVIAEVELAFPFLDGTVVAVTGSNGKSTTATLTAVMLEESGVPAVLCGNVGEPLAAQVDGPAGRVFVVELSSFQLETVRTFRADAAALLNVTPDHMDRYPDFAAYAAAKARVFERQRKSSVAVLNADDAETVAIGAGIAQARRRWFSLRRRVEDGCYVDGATVVETSRAGTTELFGTGEMAMVGSHNLENAMAASLLALATGGDRASLRRVVGRFDGLPHRTRRVRERGGVRWYDDSKGTNVGATLKSLEGFPDRTVHLILGGVGKGQDFAPLRGAVASKAKVVYLIGAAASEIETALAGAAPVKRSATLERAVAEADTAAVRGDVVLLSPACASFDQFTDFTHRGRRFQELVAALDGERDG